MIEPSLEAPQRASEVIIRRCREEVEGAFKAAIRRAFVPVFRRINGFAEIGEGFQGPRSGRIKVGRGSRVGRYAYIGPKFESHAPIVVGDLCLISRECLIIGNDHAHAVIGTPTRLGVPSGQRRPTIFEMDVWIGARVLIREGVRIGEGAIVAAGATVTRDVEPYTIVAGVPAHKIAERFNEAELAEHRALIHRVE